jgi:RNA polymerase sigma factor (sigma-70 family)
MAACQNGRMDVAANPSDDDLAARAADQDREAFDRLVDRHARPLAAWLLRRLPQYDAEDVLQEILFKSWRAAGTYKGGNYRAWLFQVARSCLTDWVRRHQRPLADWEDGPEPNDPRSVHGRADSDYTVSLERCIGLLESRERELLRARFGGEENLPAACTRFGIEKKTAQNLMSLALAKLRKCIESRSQA